MADILCGMCWLVYPTKDALWRACHWQGYLAVTCWNNCLNKDVVESSRSNSLALLYSKQNIQREECMHFFACCCMPPQVWFCLNALFGMTVGFLHNFSEQIFWSEKEKEIQSCSIFWNLWSWTSAFDKFFNMDRRVIYRPVSISPSLSLSLVLSLLLSETEISDSSLNCLRKALALSSSLVLKPKNSSPSASDAIITQGYGNLLTHFRRPIVKHITIRTYLVFCVKRNIRISPVG